jgi:hypothetical protein
MFFVKTQHKPGLHKLQPTQKVLLLVQVENFIFLMLITAAHFMDKVHCLFDC